MSGNFMVYQKRLFQIEEHSSLLKLHENLIAYLVSGLLHLQLTIHKLMVRQSVLIKNLSNIFVSLLTIDKMTGFNGFPSPNSPITIEFTVPQNFLHLWSTTVRIPVWVMKLVLLQKLPLLKIWLMESNVSEKRLKKP